MSPRHSLWLKIAGGALVLKFLLVPLLMVAVLAVLLSIAPRALPPMASLNQAFAAASMTGLPPLLHFTGGDGQSLAYRHYAPNTSAPIHGSVTLIHGSSADSRSMHSLARALATAGLAVYALDVRGHGASGGHGHIAYLGQLDDDLHLFAQHVRPAQPAMLAGFSSGGGLAFRIAAGAKAKDFAGYVLLAPFLGHDAASTRSDADGWASVSMPRMIALTILNRLGVERFNHLTVLRFGLDEWGQHNLTPGYDYNLAFNMRPGPDLAGDIARLSVPMHILVGADDELMRADAYAPLFKNSGTPVNVMHLPHTDHAGLILQARAIQRVVQASLDLLHTAASKSAP